MVLDLAFDQQCPQPGEGKKGQEEEEDDDEEVYRSSVAVTVEPREKEPFKEPLASPELSSRSEPGPGPGPEWPPPARRVHQALLTFVYPEGEKGLQAIGGGGQTLTGADSGSGPGRSHLLGE